MNAHKLGTGLFALVALAIIISTAGTASAEPDAHRSEVAVKVNSNGKVKVYKRKATVVVEGYGNLGRATVKTESVGRLPRNSRPFTVGE